MPNKGDVRADGFIWYGSKWRSPEGVHRMKTRFQTGSSFRGQDTGKATAACELLVRYDLSKRGFEVTVPVSPTAKHDLHVEIPSVGWKGVQIKAGMKHRLNGSLHLPGREHRYTSNSPILAVVFMPTNTIEYRAGTEELPEELR